MLILIKHQSIYNSDLFSEAWQNQNVTIVGPLDLIFILGEIVGDIHVFHARSIIAQNIDWVISLCP